MAGEETDEETDSVAGEDTEEETQVVAGEDTEEETDVVAGEDTGTTATVKVSASASFLHGKSSSNETAQTGIGSLSPENMSRDSFPIGGFCPKRIHTVVNLHDRSRLTDLKLKPQVPRTDRCGEAHGIVFERPRPVIASVDRIHWGVIQHYTHKARRRGAGTSVKVGPERQRVRLAHGND